MPILALISSCGGVGRTTLTASLASLAARSGAWSLALEWDPQNLLAMHFGAEHPPADGLVSRAMIGKAWNSAALQASDRTLVLPFGTLEPDALARCIQRLDADVDWLGTRLATLERPRDAWIFIDTARAPSTFAAQAVRAADSVLVVLRADAANLTLLAASRRAAAGKPLAAVVNRYAADRSGQAEILATLQQRLGTMLAPFPLHEVDAVPEAFALRAAPPDHAPDSPIAQDLHGLMHWLKLRFVDAASI